MRVLIFILGLVFVQDGLAGVGQVLGCMWDGFSLVAPYSLAIIEHGLEEYITSPYFIVGIIMSIASAYGIWFGVKGGKVLYALVSGACEIASVVSLIVSVA